MDLSLESLRTPLPERLEQLKQSGQFQKALQWIQSALQKPQPAGLKERLILEEELLRRLPLSYPYSQAEALEKLESVFSGFRQEELQSLMDLEAADWIFGPQGIQFRDNFIENIIKTRPEWSGRVQHPDYRPLTENHSDWLDQGIQQLQRQGHLDWRIHLRRHFKVNEPAPKPREILRVYLPLPIQCQQVSEPRVISLEPEPVQVASPRALQRTACFETQRADTEFVAEFELVNRVSWIDPDPKQVSALQPSFYTEEKAPHLCLTPFIRTVAQEIVGEERNPLLKAWRIYDYVTQHIQYSFMRPYFTILNIPEWCLTGGKGDCGVMALTFIALCRAVGIPARWQSGLYGRPGWIGNHDWAQYYVAPYGWLFADCSFGGSAWRTGASERWNFYRSHLDPFRIPFASEFQADFEPAAPGLRSDPYDNQSGEAFWGDRGLTHHQWEQWDEILRFEEEK